ncbi:hypothetical protein EUTSA_v10019036mg [Eutrema salsugineum]|uniref:Uncharacterized protein n=1 Tax=Eutrema salsugineum TaxID=72664 RepID=V4KAK9_EUTSA|nr:transcription repressor MYB6 [Eutrema salsugineum]ESQ28099.1 hypothetical protein EUTSA_v10019036mg [Eutrema salsugineum]
MLLIIDHACLSQPTGPSQTSIYLLFPIYIYIYHLLLANNLTNNQVTISFEEVMNKIRLRALSPPSGLKRRAKQCRVRGRNNAKLELEQSNFSKDEDDLILKLHALLGNRWSLIAGRLPGRTDNEIRIRWETYLKRKLEKMGIDPTNHRLYHHTNYISRRYLNSLHKEHEPNTTSDQSSSVSESCDGMTTILPVSSTNSSEYSTSAGHSRLPDLNIGPIPMKTTTSLPVCCLQDSSEPSNYGSTSQETLLLFR